MADRLPPLQTLRAFEAVGRRLSMTLAADELGLTHGAVSRQIKSLENNLGITLFRRMTRKIELTEAGASYFGTVTRLLSEFGRKTEAIRRKEDGGRLVVNSGVSFASKWLTPRLHRLMARYPDLDIHLDVSDAEVDFAAGRVDVAMRFGGGVYPAATSERVMNETVTPVCSPDYRERSRVQTPQDLLSCHLIHEIGWNTTWDRWFAMVDVPFSKVRGPGYSHGSMAIEAALRGEGIALGRSVLVAEDVAARRLISLFPEAKLDAEWGYDLVLQIGHRDDPKVRAFRGWIVDEICEFSASQVSSFSVAHDETSIDTDAFPPA
jgi:LysR family glycine cleavage system transcriptional activator